MKKFVGYLGQYNKFLVTLTMAFLYFLQGYTGVELPLSEEEVSMFWMVITSVLVYMVPNLKVDQ